MKTGAKWAIFLGAGIPSVLILIGLLGLLIKFFMKKCRKKPWHDIRSLPKSSANIDRPQKDNQKLKRNLSERQRLVDAVSNNASSISDEHVIIPIDENDRITSMTDVDTETNGERSLVQIQRDRLIRLKEEENRLRPMLRLSHGESEIQLAIDQAQKEFEDSI